MVALVVVGREVSSGVLDRDSSLDEVSEVGGVSRRWLSRVV